MHSRWFTIVEINLFLIILIDVYNTRGLTKVIHQ